MKLWGRILWTLLSGSMGRRGAPQGWALNSWKPRSSVSGRLNATEVVNHWTQVFEQRGIPEARESSEYIVAHVLGAKTVKCRVGDKKREEGELWGTDIWGGCCCYFMFASGCLAETGGILLNRGFRQIFVHPTNGYSAFQALQAQGGLSG